MFTRVLFISLLAAAPALADFSTRPLAGHVDAISGFTGTETFIATDPSLTDRTLHVEVDYAVFAPGDFDTLGYAFNESWGSYNAGTDYVYAFQIYNVGALNGGLSDTVLSRLSLTVPRDNLSAVGFDDSDAADIDTSGALVRRSATSFLFSDPIPGHPLGWSGLDADQYSSVLLLSSSLAPAFTGAGVLDHGLSQSGSLPGPFTAPPPVPAPGAFLLGAVGLMLAGWTKRNA